MMRNYLHEAGASLRMNISVLRHSAFVASVIRATCQNHAIETPALRAIRVLDNGRYFTAPLRRLRLTIVLINAANDATYWNAPSDARHDWILIGADPRPEARYKLAHKNSFFRGNGSFSVRVWIAINGDARDVLISEGVRNRVKGAFISWLYFITFRITFVDDY